MNRMSAVLASAGIGARLGLITLEVVGRRSGRIISLPLVMVTIHSQRYLVSMLGENVQWVRNVQANNGQATIRSRGREAVTLEEVPVAQRAPILNIYLRHAPGARPHIPVRLNAPLSEFVKIAGAYPVFRIAASEAASVKQNRVRADQKALPEVQ
jgi:deazaflavin-dependent oxidoreductase (nitroreductase family)